MLEIDAYAHASSPIRRYVDIINQFALKNKVLEYMNLERFNEQQKASKVYERELVFLDLYYNKERLLDGIVINSESIFVTALKKVIHYENTLEPRTSLKLQYYTNKQKSKWKERIVFKCVNTNSQQ